jgi:hypothetical protein
MNKVKFVLIFITCLTSFSSFANEKHIPYSYNSYIYDPLNTGNFPTNSFTLLISQDANEISYIIRGDVEEELTLCDESSEFYCFMGMDFHFAIPKKAGVKLGVWKHKEREFKTDGELKQLTIFGKKIQFYFITSTFGESDKQKTHYYLYSEEKGLLAVQVVYYNSRESYEFSFFLEQEIGFANKKKK